MFSGYASAQLKDCPEYFLSGPVHCLPAFIIRGIVHVIDMDIAVSNMSKGQDVQAVFTGCLLEVLHS